MLSMPVEADSFTGFATDANYFSQQQVGSILSSQSSNLPTQIPGGITQFTEENDLNQGINDAGISAVKTMQMSEIEKMLGGALTGNVSERLKQFGYDIFQRPVLPFLLQAFCELRNTPAAGFDPVAISS